MSSFFGSPPGDFLPFAVPNPYYFYSFSSPFPPRGFYHPPGPSYFPILARGKSKVRNFVGRINDPLNDQRCPLKPELCAASDRAIAIARPLILSPNNATPSSLFGSISEMGNYRSSHGFKRKNILLSGVYPCLPYSYPPWIMGIGDILANSSLPVFVGITKFARGMADRSQIKERPN